MGGTLNLMSLGGMAIAIGAYSILQRRSERWLR